MKKNFPRCFLIVFALFINLNGITQNYRLCIPNSHTDRISSWEISPNKKMFATASFDNKAIIWDIRTGKKLIELLGHQDAVKSAVFSPDNDYLVTSSNDKSIKIWDVKSGKILNSLSGHRGFIYLAKLSPDGSKILSVGSDSTIIVWEMKTGKIIFSLYTPEYSPTNAFFSNDSKLLLANYNSREMKTWDIKTGKSVFTLSHSDISITTGFSKNGKYIISHTVESGLVQIWDTKTGTNISSINNNSPYVRYSAFDPLSKKIITKSNDYKIRLFEMSTGKLLAKIEEAEFTSYEPKFNNDGTKVVFMHKNGFAIWNLGSQKIDTIFNTNKELQDIHFTSIPETIFLEYENGSFDMVGKDNWRHFSSFNNNYVPKIEDANFYSNDDKIFFSTENSFNVIELKVANHSKVTINNFKDAIPWYEFLKDPEIDFKNKRGIHVAVNDIELVDIEKGSVLKRFISPIKDDISQVASAEFDHTSEKLIVAYKYEKLIIVWDIKTGIILLRMKLENEIKSASFTPDSKKILIISPENTIQIVNAESGSLLSKLIGHKSEILEYDLNQDGSILATASRDSTAIIWEVATGKVINILEGHSSMVNHIKFSPDNKTIITGSYDNTAMVWDIKTGKLLFTLKGHTEPVSLGFSNNNNKIILASADKSISVWDNHTGKKYFTFLFVDTLNHLFILPNGLYKATTGSAKKLHYVTKDLKIITFDQLDIKYNRPDKVLEAIGSTDTALINSYRQAYYKRIKKLGVDTTSFKEGFTIPEADFKNREIVEYEQKTKQLKLNITGSSTENLDRFNVWVNEVPVYGQKGIGLRSRNKKIMDTTITITISEGDNQIETSVTDVNGIESYRQPLFVKYIPEKPASSKTYFIGIGINRFADSSNNLSWSVKDIRDLSKRFATKGAIIDTLFDENVTQSSVALLKKKLEGTSEEDKVIIAYSGHGLLSKEYDYYLSTFNVDFNQPEKNGLPYDELEGLLDGIKARKKLMLIDACHSGEVDKEEMQHYKTVEDTLKNNNVKKGIILENKDQSKLGMKNSFELMQELFVNVGRSTGATIISAAAGTQFALERNDLKNGVFTYSLLELMNNNSTLKVSDLKKTVTEKVPQLTGGLQKPTFRNENQQFDWTLW